jgi:hypothetical protein
MAVGRLIGWIVLLGIPSACMAVAVLALSGNVDLDPMWIALSSIMSVVSIHGAQRVRWDELRTVSYR